MSYYEYNPRLNQPIALQVRSQSESAALNSINIKVPRNLLHELELCRQKLNGNSPTRYNPVSFYGSIQDGIQSDSEGDDSLVSSEDGGSSSSAGCEEHDDVEDDLGVVRDLELDDDHRHCHLEKDEPSTPTSPHQYNGSAQGKSLADFVADHCFYQPAQPKKSVRFADDCGNILETVRVMTEPSDYPPRISPSVIRRYRKAAAAASSSASANGPHNEDDDEEEEEEETAARQPRSSWKMAFKQPASEYVKFRETLENQKVALENVMLKNEIGRMVGTIKVANISFEKRVFVRYTSDNWKSFMDRPAVYQSSPSKHADTFRFDIELPRNTCKDSKICFCVCFVAGEVEYWDSNGGKNFVLTSPDQPLPAHNNNNNHSHENQNPCPLRVLDRDDAYRLEPTDWTKFASWKNLSTTGPYY